MKIEYEILDVNTLIPSANGTRYKITTLDSGSIIKEICYDFHTKLSYDPAGGTITAEIYNYDDSIAAGYSNPIEFDYEGNKVSAVPVNGEATISFSSTVAGEHVITTNVPNCNNGSVTVHV